MNEVAAAASRPQKDPDMIRFLDNAAAALFVVPFVAAAASVLVAAVTGAPI